MLDGPIMSLQEGVAPLRGNKGGNAISAELVGERGFEPLTPASRTLCASQTALLPGQGLHYTRNRVCFKEAGLNITLG